MAYLGNTPASRFSSMQYQDLTGVTGSPTAKRDFTLSHSVGNENEIEVFVNNVRQEPSVAYTVSGTLLSMTGDVETTDDFYVVFQGLAQQTATHPSNSALQASTGTFSSTLSVAGASTLTGAATATGGLNVGTIKDVTGTTTALSISSNGLVTHPTRPIFSVRGNGANTSLTAADTNFDYISTWTTTDVNVGGLLNAGGYAQAPTGFGGIYQITWVTNSQQGSLNFNSAEMYHYDGSTYTNLVRHYAYNDYSNYSTGTTFFYQLDEGDIIYAGFDDRYSEPSPDDNKSNFSMMFVG